MPAMGGIRCFAPVIPPALTCLRLEAPHQPVQLTRQMRKPARVFLRRTGEALDQSRFVVDLLDMPVDFFGDAVLLFGRGGYLQVLIPDFIHRQLDAFKAFTCVFNSGHAGA